MKNKIKTTIALLVLGVTAVAVNAQEAGGPPGNGGPGRMRGHRPPPPVIAALDANHDGVIDADEIASASAALKTLDINGDGQLTRDELRPQGRPPGADRQGPPPGAGSQGPPPDQN